jgi:hypothetical protein
MIDGLIERKVENPRLDVKDNEVIEVIKKLIKLDGLDV